MIRSDQKLLWPANISESVVVVCTLLVSPVRRKPEVKPFIPTSGNSL